MKIVVDVKKDSQKHTDLIKLLSDNGYVYLTEESIGDSITTEKLELWHEKSLRLLKEYYASDEGKQEIKRSKIEDKKIKKRNQRWANRFKAWIEKDLNSNIEKLRIKYDSDKYVIREMRMGYEPRTSLLWFLLDYAREHGELVFIEDNPFTDEAYYIGDYLIQSMSGQGTVVKLERVNF